MINPKVSFGLCIFALIVPLAHAQVFENVERQLEEKRLMRLSHEQQKGVEISPFETDGCSGGQSNSWAFFAARLPKFVEHFGARPPWESCCIAHDKLYWQGETKNGYEKRREADLALKRCVIAVGENLAPSLSTRYGLRTLDVLTSFKITAELMYRAVRVGGKPCTPFSWRWGYGWPPC